MAHQLLELVRAPIDVGGRTLNVGGSIGLAMYPEHGDTKARLLRCADLAMYIAKAHGGGIARYAAELDDSQPLAA